MDRIIKFRGKLLNTDNWEYGYLYKFIDGTCYIFPATIKNHRPIVKPETVGQFIGIPDKKGKEIYDGDVLLVKNRTHDNGTPYRVYWNKSGWHLIHANGDGDEFGTYTLNIDRLKPEQMEIIGSIHDPTPQ